LAKLIGILFGRRLSFHSIFYHSSRLFSGSTVTGVSVLDTDEGARSWFVRRSKHLAFAQERGGGCSNPKSQVDPQFLAEISKNGRRQ
jgi:hypothetical protein